MCVWLCVWLCLRVRVHVHVVVAVCLSVRVRVHVVVVVCLSVRVCVWWWQNAVCLVCKGRSIGPSTAHTHLPFVRKTTFSLRTPRRDSSRMFRRQLAPSSSTNTTRRVERHGSSSIRISGDTWQSYGSTLAARTGLSLWMLCSRQAPLTPGRSSLFRRRPCAWCRGWSKIRGSPCGTPMVGGLHTPGLVPVPSTAGPGSTLACSGRCGAGCCSRCGSAGLVA